MIPLVLDQPGFAPAAPQDALASSLAKLQPRTLAQQVIEALVGAAAEGLILPGDRIIETELAQRLGVSRVPVREALRVLESQGIVINEPYKGIRLTPVTPERIDQLIEVRVALETTALTRAIRLGRTDATRLAATTNEHLALDDNGAAELLRRCARLGDRKGNPALSDRDARFREQLFALMLV